MAEGIEEPGRIGGCPECGGDDGYMNVSRTHWLVCNRHKTKWCIGANLFSDWKDETEEEWEKNAQLLAGYRQVEPTRKSNPVTQTDQRNSLDGTLCLKADNISIRDHCGRCNTLTDSGRVGLFIEGTWTPVCNSCGMQEARELVFLKEIFERFDSFEHARGMTRERQLLSIDGEEPF